MRILTIILLTFCTSTLFGQKTQQDPIKIQDALESNFLKLEIEGFYGKSKYKPIDYTGVYFGKCITIIFDNVSDSSLFVQMPVGSILKCRDTSVQDMIVTKSFIVKLYPKSKDGYLIYAMCGEISDASPTQGKFYDYGGLAEPDVVKIAQLIELKNIQNSLGQYTMWAVRNDLDSTTLIHYGASYSDLQSIVNSLYEVNISTKLTEQIEHTNTESNVEEVLTSEVDKHELVNKYEINTLTWLLFGICGVLALLIALISIKKKNNP